tara:strand:- start:17705 stop:17932 length:228 start_codon:yes stop_codon:yes gene_type:complete
MKYQGIIQDIDKTSITVKINLNTSDPDIRLDGQIVKIKTETAYNFKKDEQVEVEIPSGQTIHLLGEIKKDNSIFR